MAKVTVSIPQGTRDFPATIVRKRQYILQTIRTVFELYGFAPLETPAMENLDTLMGKYGEEGDKLIFKILNNGLQDGKNIVKAKAAFENILQGKNDKDLTERALKYDLTIPFARYVAMNHGQLAFPFKRYQMQPVWRADRPQKGRYREFWQCDADVVGSTSLLNEVELIGIYSDVFAKLKIPVVIKLNSRKVLAALAVQCGGLEQLTNITTAIDKLDKIGLGKVKEELLQRGITPEATAYIEKYLTIAGTSTDKINALQNLLGEAAAEAIADFQFILTNIAAYGIQEPEIDLTLARGLNYYTGCILEIKAINVAMGSIGGGGRYDDLTGTFGVPGIAGVGISFGLDRIYDVLEELQLFPEAIETGTKVLFFNLGENETNTAFALMQPLRKAGTACEIYPEAVKMDKQFKYAEKKNIPYVVIIGSKELAQNSCTVKNIITGIQEDMAQEKLVVYFTSL